MATRRGFLKKALGVVAGGAAVVATSGLGKGAEQDKPRKTTVPEAMDCLMELRDAYPSETDRPTKVTVAEVLLGENATDEEILAVQQKTARANRKREKERVLQARKERREWRDILRKMGVRQWNAKTRKWES